MVKKATPKKKPARHVAGHDAEREAIQAGLRRAVRREQEIQKLTRQLQSAMKRTQIGLEGLHGVLTDLVTEDEQPPAAEPTF